MANQATHDDAMLILRLFELRREEKMRKARDWFGREFFPQSIEDFKTVKDMQAQENEYYRMVISYWDMAASFVVSGALNGPLFLQSGGEMIFVWAKIGDFVPHFREFTGNPEYLSNIENVIASVPGAADRVAATKKFIAQMRESLANSAKG
ncbi:MAG TPA: hypothetical protein VI756_21105 [Blastocatellia bacterium]